MHCGFLAIWSRSWKNLHCGDKNTFSFHGNTLSLSAEKNPERQRMWKRERVTKVGERKPFVWRSHSPFSLFPFSGVVTDSIVQLSSTGSDPPSLREYVIHPTTHILSLRFYFHLAVWNHRIYLRHYSIYSLQMSKPTIGRLSSPLPSQLEQLRYIEKFFFCQLFLKLYDPSHVTNL